MTAHGGASSVDGAGLHDALIPLELESAGTGTPIRLIPVPGIIKEETT